MKKLLVANWKLNPNSLKRAMELAKEIDKLGVVICPPFVYLEEVGKRLKKAKLGAQDLYWEKGGPYTGEISAEQIKRLGGKYVIVGHSERRKYLSETDEIINKKLKTAISGGLTPILCIGEGVSVKRKGPTAVKKFLDQQIKKGLERINKRKIIIAYEPIWAIGTGKPEKAEEAEEIMSYISKKVDGKTKILYGGSVDARNAKGFLAKKDVAGLLIGGTSLKSTEFNKIVKYNL